MRSPFLKPISAVFLCACAAGFSYQLACLNAQYFKYVTFTRIRIQAAKKSYAPDLHICPATSQVFNTTAYNAKAKVKVGNITGWREVLRFQNTMTVAQLLEYSPSANDVIRKCTVRRPEDMGFSYLDRDECHVVFNVTKYYTLEYICYTVILKPLKDDKKYDTFRLNLAVNYPGVYYEFTLNDIWMKLLNNFRTLSMERHYGDKSLSLAPVISRGLERNTALYNLFRVSKYEIEYHRLLPPYDTRCRDYLSEGLPQWHRLREPRAYSPVDKRPLSSHDMRNKTLALIFAAIGNSCTRACAQVECDQTWAITTVDMEYQLDGILFSVVAPKEPSFLISHEAQLTIESYLIFAMSCIGSWFGLSVLSFNPITIMDRAQGPARSIDQNGSSDFGTDVKKGMTYLVKLIKDMNHMKHIIRHQPPLGLNRREVMFHRCENSA
ncbi:hypothetical protein HDE_01918 [Halotydeus destructor]|nr:hypothetical protein HDE_01918 [Halotydeus destructor]